MIDLKNNKVLVVAHRILRDLGISAVGCIIIRVSTCVFVPMTLRTVPFFENENESCCTKRVLSIR
jgi:hypothetical protein